MVTSAYSLVLLLVLLRRTIAGNIAGNTGDAFGKAQPIWLPRHSTITPAVTGAPQNKYASAEWALFRLAVPRFARTQVPLTSLMIAITAAQTNDNCRKEGSWVGASECLGVEICSRDVEDLVLLVSHCGIQAPLLRYLALVHAR